MNKFVRVVVLAVIAFGTGAVLRSNAQAPAAGGGKKPPNIVIWQWHVDHAFILVPAQQYVGQFLATFKEFPPSQHVGSFSLDAVLESLSKGSGDK